jgi:hypothetical protein
MTRPRRTPDGDAIMTRMKPTSGERQSRLSRGQAWAGHIVTTHPMPFLGGTGSHDLLEANPEQAVHF